MEKIAAYMICSANGCTTQLNINETTFSVSNLKITHGQCNVINDFLRGYGGFSYM